jgi:GMP synthase-like glutamine amidotransferase
MRIAILQHVPFEGPAAIAHWAESRGAKCEIYHVYRGDAAPAQESFDFLVIMGGPMSVNDTGELPWLVPETDFVRSAIEAGKAVLGVCLGAQMIAKAMGARVYPGCEKEIGWFPIRRAAPDGGTLFDGLPESFTAFHWHGETFDLPEGAVRLAETEVTPNQAFQLGSRVFGLQFHIEATPDSVAALTEKAAGEIGEGRFQMKPDAIMAGTDACEAMRPMLDTVLARLTAA